MSFCGRNLEKEKTRGAEGYFESVGQYISLSLREGFSNCNVHPGNLGILSVNTTMTGPCSLFLNSSHVGNGTELQTKLLVGRTKRLTVPLKRNSFKTLRFLIPVWGILLCNNITVSRRKKDTFRCSIYFISVSLSNTVLMSEGVVNCIRVGIWWEINIKT